jgi:hypothetical protein
MISIDELKSLPLTHGSFLLDDNWDAIKTNGLVASGGQSCGPNTFDLDVAMQRNEFVFSTIAHRYGYSLGDYVVIHPDVIYEVKCSIHFGTAGYLEKVLSSTVSRRWTTVPWQQLSGILTRRSIRLQTNMNGSGF